tara:strand:- start:273 stop:770 length:498 start_codon:yes stop_codon:yes gene_type:complete
MVGTLNNKHREILEKSVSKCVKHQIKISTNDLEYIDTLDMLKENSDNKEQYTRSVAEYQMKLEENKLFTITSVTFPEKVFFKSESVIILDNMTKEGKLVKVGSSYFHFCEKYSKWFSFSTNVGRVSDVKTIARIEEHVRIANNKNLTKKEVEKVGGSKEKVTPKK